MFSVKLTLVQTNVKNKCNLKVKNIHIKMKSC